MQQYKNISNTCFQVEKDWQIEQAFVLEQLQSIYRYDLSQSSHPLTHTVNKPIEIARMFDPISYKKGASIIRMLRHLIGDESFIAGIRKYLKAL